MTKQEIRAEMRKRRKALSPTDRAATSGRICERLSALLLPNSQTSPPTPRLRWAGKHPNSQTRIAVYLASPDEIDLTRFIEDAIEKGCRLAAPRWNGNVYELAELNGCWPTGLVAGPHAILEPPQDAPTVAPSEVRAWIVPGLAFSTDGARLGYGGGWYDRLMAGARPDARKIGVCHSFQVVDALPSEPHDVRLQEIVVG